MKVKRVTKGDHNSTNSMNQKFKCEICQKELSSKKILARHKSQLHGGTKTKLVRCKIRGCDYTTPRQSNMKTHMNKHLYFTPLFKCKYKCGSSFSSESNRRKHHNSKHPEGEQTLLQCTYCDETFTYKKNLDRHVAHACTKSPHGKVNRTDSVKERGRREELAREMKEDNPLCYNVKVFRVKEKKRRELEVWDVEEFLGKRLGYKRIFQEWIGDMRGKSFDDYELEDNPVKEIRVPQYVAIDKFGHKLELPTLLDLLTHDKFVNGVAVDVYLEHVFKKIVNATYMSSYYIQESKHGFKIIKQYEPENKFKRVIIMFARLYDHFLLYLFDLRNQEKPECYILDSKIFPSRQEQRDHCSQRQEFANAILDGLMPPKEGCNRVIKAKVHRGIARQSDDGPDRNDCALFSMYNIYHIVKELEKLGLNSPPSISSILKNWSKPINFTNGMREDLFLWIMRKCVLSQVIE